MKKNIQKLLFLIYIISVVYITILSRDCSFQARYILYPLWSYAYAIRGNISLAKEIIQNIILFIPFGYFVSDTFNSDKIDESRYYISTVLIIIVVTSMIEVIQLVSHRGLFEFDDIINNFLGSLFGIGLYKLISNRGRKFRYIISSVFVFCSLIACVMFSPENKPYERQYYFQPSIINETLQGECFIIGKNTPDKYSIVLKNDTSTISLPTQTGIDQPDINSYYESEYNYLNCGFVADVSSVPDGTYEIFVDFKKYGLKETGCYLVDREIKYSVDPGVQANNEITQNGYLLVAQNHCYVYQYKGNLYWFIDEEYPFEEDRTTYIQYQLWTTQSERLPQVRIDNGWDWDNIGFVFEEYEMEPIGKYRVAMRPLPTEYSITSIVTGYHKDGKWIWKDYFRPVLTELVK